MVTRTLDFIVSQVGLALMFVVTLTFGLWMVMTVRDMSEVMHSGAADRIETHILHTKQTYNELLQMLLALEAAGETGPNAAVMTQLTNLHGENLSGHRGSHAHHQHHGDAAVAAMPDPRINETLEPALDAIENVKSTALLATQSSGAEFVKLLDELKSLIAVARAALGTHLNRLQAIEVEVHGQHDADRHRMVTMSYAFVAVVTFVALACLFLLRREILQRRKREQAERRADFLAYFDSLTKLPNRAQFQDRVMARMADSQSSSLVLVDIDLFKDCNDRLGHAMGDALLIEVGQRLEQVAVKYNGFAARLGGDEFAISIGMTDEKALNGFCKALQDVTRKPVSLGGETVQPSISIGVATTSSVAPAMAANYETMMRVADFCLYVSKSAGRGRYSVFDEELLKQFTERRAMIDDLPRALAQKELEVFLQPKVDMRTRQVYGFEALVRWMRDGTLVPPGEFIQVAEESGLILEIDKTMIEQTVQIISHWNAQHGTEYSVSVNVSALHLLRGGLVRFVADVVGRHSLPPSCLTLEITESIELEEWDKVIVQLNQLRDIGCRIAIDDFGTGYSSLAYLRAIEADELKIDKSLINEIETSDELQFIVDAVLDLARSLRLDVVIEGIETNAQLQILLGLGGHLGQGYLFGRPRPAREMLADVTYSTVAMGSTA